MSSTSKYGRPRETTRLSLPRTRSRAASSPMGSLTQDSYAPEGLGIFARLPPELRLMIWRQLECYEAEWVETCGWVTPKTIWAPIWRTSKVIASEILPSLYDRTLIVRPWLPTSLKAASVDDHLRKCYTVYTLKDGNEAVVVKYHKLDRPTMGFPRFAEVGIPWRRFRCVKLFNRGTEFTGTLQCSCSQETKAQPWHSKVGCSCHFRHKCLKISTPCTHELQERWEVVMMRCGKHSKARKSTMSLAGGRCEGSEASLEQASDNNAAAAIPGLDIHIVGLASLKSSMTYAPSRSDQ